MPVVNMDVNILHVEVAQKHGSHLPKGDIVALVEEYLGKFASLTPGEVLGPELLVENQHLSAHVQCITLCAIEQENSTKLVKPDLVYHVYTLNSLPADTDTMTVATNGDESSMADVWKLPNAEFHGLWESLIYETSVKRSILRVVESGFDFAERGVDVRKISFNRTVLLHGPPGTGKTSLCRAVAQKLAIRLADKYSRAQLLEINAHSLFSKWFSESGKLVAQLFDRVQEVVSDPRALACVLIDEVESLAAARKAAIAGLEPSDALRAVNALLHQLDRLRSRPNALVLATSNVTQAIDHAFLDRADLKLRIGPPGEQGAYEILRDCCAEATSRGVCAAGVTIFPWRLLEAARWGSATAPELRLRGTARLAASRCVSGRALRRLPLLAHALHLPAPPAPPATLLDLVDALHAALQQHLADDADMREDDLLRPSLRSDKPPHCDQNGDGGVMDADG